MEFLDADGDGAGRLEGVDEISQALEVGDVGGFDDVAEYYYEGDEWSIEDCPGGNFSQSRAHETEIHVTGDRLPEQTTEKKSQRREREDSTYQ